MMIAAKSQGNTLSLIAGEMVAAHATAGTDGRIFWMRVMPAGTFTLRDGRGPFHAGDQERMQAIVDRTLERAAGTELMVDYDHQSFYGAIEGVGGTAKAAGWIKRLEARADGIWAQVEWTEAAASAIRAQEYRYLSPLFLAPEDTGDVRSIANIGLVNMPALDLDAVAAALTPPKTETSSMEAIARALGLDAGASPETITAAIGMAQAAQTALAGIGKALDLDDDASPDDIGKAVAALAELRGKVASGLKLEDDADDAAIIAAAAAVAGKDNPDPAKYVPIAAMKAVQDDLKALKTRIDGDDAERAVDQAVKDGRLVPAQREWGLNLAKTDRKSFDDYVGSAPRLTATQLERGKPVPAATELDDTDTVVARQLGLSAEDMKKSKQQLAGA